MVELVGSPPQLEFSVLLCCFMWDMLPNESANRAISDSERHGFKVNLTSKPAGSKVVSSNPDVGEQICSGYRKKLNSS